MTKKKAKASARPIRAKAATAKTSVTKRSAAPADNGAATLIVLGFDDQQKPRGARFDHDKPDLVTKAAELMGLKVYQATSETWPPSPKNCPSVGCMPTAEGLCRTSGRTSTATSLPSWRSNRGGAEPGNRQGQPARCPRPAADLGRDRAWPSRDRSGVARIMAGGRRSSLIEKTTGSRCGSAITRQLPKFFRHRSAIALMNPPSEEATTVRPFDLT